MSPLHGGFFQTFEKEFTSLLVPTWASRFRDESSAHILHTNGIYIGTNNPDWCIPKYIFITLDLCFNLCSV